MDAVTKADETGAAERRAPPRRPFWRRNENALLGTLAVAVFLAIWESAVHFGWVNPLFTSAPSRITRTAVQIFADGSILSDPQVSGFEFAVGYGVAVATV